MITTNEELVMALRSVLPEIEVTINQTILEQHSSDESYHSACLPDIVVFPTKTEEVSKIMNIANQYKVPIVPFGRGTSLEGHVIPYNHGITIDFSLM